MPHADDHTAATPMGSGPLPDLRRAFVRVTGTRLDRFVEFEFSIGDADLTVELVMPFQAFKEFCADTGAIVLDPAPEAALPAARAGLYRRPDAASPEQKPGTRAAGP